MADITPELYEKIKESFDRRYAQAALLGGPLSETLAKINNGTATFIDANLYATEVGAIMAEAMKENLILDELPGGRLYKNIAQRTIGEGLKDTYGIVSSACKVAQEEHNAAAGIGLKAVQPKLETKRVDDIVNRAVVASTQQALDATLEAAVPNFAKQVVDDTQKANARFHNKVGLKVTVEREYDDVGLHNGTDVCDWCLSREGKFDYEKAMDVGAFERHEGCGCIITYTSAKGEKTISTGKYSGWLTPEEREKEVLGEAENSNKLRKSLNQSTLINKQYIESPEYRRKLNDLGENNKVTRSVNHTIKSILTHRDGTEYEDLAYVNSISGISKINKGFDKVRTCKPSNRMSKFLNQSSNGSIIGVHNHPNSTPPSIGDIFAARDRGYKYGVIACHDGTVYKYSVDQVFNETNARIYLDRLGKSAYNFGIGSKEFTEALNLLKDNGIVIEVF